VLRYTNSLFLKTTAYADERGVVLVFLKRVFCLFDRHTARRSTMYWDNDAFVSECRHCRRQVRRISRGKWKIDPLTGGEFSPLETKRPRSSS
jgi:hypothetical protein